MSWNDTTRTDGGMAEDELHMPQLQVQKLWAVLGEEASVLWTDAASGAIEKCLTVAEAMKSKAHFPRAIFYGSLLATT